MNKMNVRSKKFIQLLTTVIRALQFALPDVKKIPDPDAIKLFLNLYKLLFLGSPFAQKMLNIKIESAV